MQFKFRAFVEYEDRDKFIYPSRITFMPTVIYVYDSELDYEHQIEPKYLQQWTGLFDKNKKEIYEGDIVYGFWQGINGTESDKRVVKFKLGSFDIWSKFVEGSDERLNCEVIGNIYENTRLLK